MKSKYLLFVLAIPIVVTAKITGKVIRISDGDTFTILAANSTQYKIRLHGIDCPEKVQPYGKKAKDYTSRLILGKTVMVDSLDQDRYGRIVGIVYSEGKVVNEELLKTGLAWHYLKYDTSSRWMELTNKAKEKNIGLWKEPCPLAPWLWRKRQK